MIQEFLNEITIPWFIQLGIGGGVILLFSAVLNKVLKAKKLCVFLGKYPAVSLLIAAVIQFGELEIANHNVFFKTMSVLYMGINILTLFLFMWITYMVLNRAWLSMMIWQTAVTIAGVGNYYTLHFRGTPVTAQDVPSIATAINVSADLEFTLQIIATFLVTVSACCIVYAMELRKLEIFRKGLYAKRLCKTAAAVLVIWFFYFCSYSPKPLNTSAWIWRDQYWVYGYTACSFESVQRAVNIIEKPDDYTVSATQEKMADFEESLVNSELSEKPDIILILNETFYDFSLIHDFQTDEPVTPYLDSLTDVIRGYVVVPTIGGGTNRSEYELLTSNSLYLMKDILPFWSLDLKGANSVSSVLQQQGYYTAAYHQGHSKNYNRDKKYVEMGFDDIWFAENMETYELVHGNISDKSGYDYIIEKYENRDVSKPFFVYNLTMQNHISYRTDMDISVEVEAGFDGMEEQANIYLSCLRESDRAFQYLTEYFSKVERPVIICMLGDHGPDYAATVQKKDNLSDTVRKYGERCTPLLVWSNYGLEQEDWGIISMPYVVPKVLETAGVESSAYYQYISEMAKEIPILTAYDSYCGEDGVIRGYGEEGIYSDIIQDYWCFEYYNVREQDQNRFFKIGE